MINVLTGDNDFLIQQKARSIKEDFIKQYSDLAIEQYDGNESEISVVASALTSLPFLVDKKLIILKSFAANKEFSDVLENVLDDQPEHLDLLLIEPKLDKRLSIYKLLAKKTEFSNFVRQELRDLPKWVIETTKNRGGNIDLRTAEHLVNTIGSNQLSLNSEIDKLLINSKTITLEAIDSLCERTINASIFDLIEAAFSDNLAKLFNLYLEVRQQNIEPPQIIALLSWQLNLLILLNLAKDKSNSDIAREAKVNPYALQKSRPIASRLTLAKLKSLVSELLSIDIAIKTSNVDSDEILQNFFLSIAY